MSEYLVAIHRDLTSKTPKPSAEQMQAAMKPYQEWVAGIGAKNQLVGTPKRWDIDGRTISKDKVANGPFEQNNFSIGGLFLIKADSYEEAVEIASGCPIIEYGAVVEVRMAIPPVA